jgi:hypothetical protein
MLKVKIFEDLYVFKTQFVDCYFFVNRYRYCIPCNAIANRKDEHKKDKISASSPGRNQLKKLKENVMTSIVVAANTPNEEWFVPSSTTHAGNNSAIYNSTSIMSMITNFISISFRSIAFDFLL